jgi:cysteinyl-tRNA synthetase
LQLNDDKMSKSSGSFLTLSKLIELGFNPLDYRYFCLSAHYRKKINFSYEALTAAKNTRNKLIQKFRYLKDFLNDSHIDKNKIKLLINEFNAKLFNDLDSVEALAFMHITLKNEQLADNIKAGFLQHIDEALALGLFCEASKVEEDSMTIELQSFIQLKINERIEAKKNKNFALADEIRANLLKEGIVLEDTTNGTVWRKI